jgi:Immunity protein Imm1
MADWHLVDSMHPSESPDGFPAVVIRSPEQLRAELGRLRQREPAIVGLEGPGGHALEIGSGGPFAGLRQFRNQRAWRVALADRTHSAKSVDFAFEQGVLTFWPDELLPVDQAIAAIAHFYEHQQLPDWLSYKEWDDGKKEWVVKRAPGQEPPAPPPTLSPGEVPDTIGRVS